MREDEDVDMTSERGRRWLDGSGGCAKGRGGRTDGSNRRKSWFRGWFREIESRDWELEFRGVSIPVPEKNPIRVSAFTVEHCQRVYWIAALFLT